MSEIKKKDLKKSKRKHKDLGPSYGSQEQPQGFKGDVDDDSEVDVGI